MTGPSLLETGSGHVTRMGARKAFGVLAVVVVLSGCARFETSGDDVTRRPSEAYQQIILRDAYSRTSSPVLAGDPQGCFHCGTAAEAPISFALYFTLDSDRLTAAGQTAIDAAVTTARKIGATDFAVTGHLRLVGPDTHNMEPALRRAKVVSEALVARGIDPARINIANQVDVEPTVATVGDLGELASRRVDIVLLKQD